MAAKKATKTANVSISLYDGEFQIGFDCVGVMVCQFAMCSEMPIDGKEECFFKEYGSCRRPAAQQTTLERLINRLKRELKQLEEDSEA
ncbi:MAG: hypothetical protein M0T70_02830 [Geobacteraceae bacterium]|nr:hypothetical protein [Geobacteraceae bacterium]